MKLKSILWTTVLALFFVSAANAQQPSPARCSASNSAHNQPTSLVQFECTVPLENIVTWQIYNGKFQLFSPAYSINKLNSSMTQTEFTPPVNGNVGTFAFTWSGTGTDGNFHSGTISGTWTQDPWRGWWYQTIETSTLTIIN